MFARRDITTECLPGVRGEAERIMRQLCTDKGVLLRKGLRVEFAVSVASALRVLCSSTE